MVFLYFIGGRGPCFNLCYKSLRPPNIYDLRMPKFSTTKNAYFRVSNHRFLRFKFHWETRLRPYIFLISFLLFRFNSEAPSWPKLKLKVVGLKTWLTSGGQYVQSMKMGHLYIKSSFRCFEIIIKIFFCTYFKNTGIGKF